MPPRGASPQVDKAPDPIGSSGFLFGEILEILTGSMTYSLGADPLPAQGHRAH